MSLIRDTLIQIRTELGFDSAKAFYRHLSERRTLEFNYAHYMKIEGAKTLPSAALISALGSVLEAEQSDRLVLAYCETLFPNKRHLFKNTANSASSTAPKPVAAPPPLEPQTLLKQQYLTDAQIASISRSSLHYSLFLILTLARKAISNQQLTETLSQTDAGTAAQLNTALSELTKARLILKDDAGIRSIAHEMRFPKAENDAIKRMYDQIDAWNIDFDRRAGFESLVQKMMIRRVSSRYLGVILSHCNVMLELIRASEEINVDFNDDVLMLNFSLSRGKLPG